MSLPKVALKAALVELNHFCPLKVETPVIEVFSCHSVLSETGYTVCHDLSAIFDQKNQLHTAVYMRDRLSVVGLGVSCV